MAGNGVADGNDAAAGAKPTDQNKLKPVPKKSFSFLPAIFAVLAGVVTTLYIKSQPKPFELMPSSLPLVKDSTLFNASYHEDMYWGTYRSGMYAGIRPRSPLPLMAGLMWGSPYKKTAHVMRHEASKDHGIETFGWTRHDLRSYGDQFIKDGPLGINMQWYNHPGRGLGGDWLLTLNVTRDPEADPSEIVKHQSVYLYLGQTSPDETLTGDATFESEQGVDLGELMQGGGSLFSVGKHPEMGDWLAAVRVLKADDESGERWGSVSMMSAKAKDLHKMHDVVQHSINKKVATAPPDDDCEGCMMQEYPDGANVAVLQVQFTPPFSMDIAFASGLRSEKPHERTTLGALQMAKLVGSKRDELLDAKIAAFDARFQEMTRGKLDQATQELGENALSEVLGSMGYFHGSTVVQKTPEERVMTVPQPLFSAVPSRSFFPRGFLWDEGFHQLLVQQWDLQASCDAIAHWLDLINADGWIPREQILGVEARARVPEEFLAQKPDVANPPTLFLPLMKLAQALNGDPAAAGLLQDPHAKGIERERWLDFLQRAWPRLNLWLNWLESQAGSQPASYRWRGREDLGDKLNPLTLASGLDDYPRASHPSADERHVDLRCWMAFATRAMLVIGEAIEAPEKEMAPLRRKEHQLSDYSSLKALHWDEKAGTFLDWGLHTEDVVLQTSQPNPKQQPKLVRAVTHTQPKAQFVPHIGYNSLFPLALQLIPWDSPDIKAQLALLREPKLLWSDYGLRSLATTSSLYKKFNDVDDAPYWRGDVWVNVNFLVLRSLHACSKGDGPYAKECTETYGKLRENLLTNIWNQFDSEANHFIWESYSDVDGSGKGTHPMGWSALIALIAVEHY